MMRQIISIMASMATAIKATLPPVQANPFQSPRADICCCLLCGCAHLPVLLGVPHHAHLRQLHRNNCWCSCKLTLPSIHFSSQVCCNNILFGAFAFIIEMKKHCQLPLCTWGCAVTVTMRDYLPMCITLPSLSNQWQPCVYVAESEVYASCMYGCDQIGNIMPRHFISQSWCKTSFRLCDGVDVLWRSTWFVVAISFIGQKTPYQMSMHSSVCTWAVSHKCICPGSEAEKLHIMMPTAGYNWDIAVEECSNWMPRQLVNPRLFYYNFVHAWHVKQITNSATSV